MSGKAVVDAKPRRGRRRKAGDLATLRRVMWAGLLEVERILLDPKPEVELAELKLRAVSAMATLGGAYGRVTKDHAFEERLEDLRKELYELQEATGRPGVAGSGRSATAAN